MQYFTLRKSFFTNQQSLPSLHLSMDQKTRKILSKRGQNSIFLVKFTLLNRGPSIYYVHPQGGWVGCCGVYPEVLWWVGGFCLDVHTHHVKRKWIPILVVFLVYSWLSKIHGLLVHLYSLYVVFWYRMQPFYRKITAVQYKLQHIPKKLFKVGGSA